MLSVDYAFLILLLGLLPISSVGGHCLRLLLGAVGMVGGFAGVVVLVAVYLGVTLAGSSRYAFISRERSSQADYCELSKRQRFLLAWTKLTCFGSTNFFYLGISRYYCFNSMQRRPHRDSRYPYLLLRLPGPNLSAAKGRLHMVRRVQSCTGVQRFLV